MENENFYIFLDIIFKNGSIQRLARKGVDYIEIANFTKKAIEENLIENLAQKIALTEKGIELHNLLEKNYKKIKKDEWIEKDKKSQIAKLEKNTIFVPRQDELTF
ncbi:hypothetical protein B0A75_12905 [Flavobacterium oncorhynchi]|uniref:Uncharacterized protein n=1 Tax=Flavobacterium oncorhynchi TaxID=728056 RepID=A0A226HZX6_9FLAO|nr:hypothetical protein [Flavobacterium oncorhynchi]OXA98960.1 hypothetical protein B0A75_12905 [Flavobacterium oncorhynchi]